MTEHTLLKLRREFERTHPKATLTDFQAEMMNHGKELAEFGEKWTTYQTTRHAEAIRYLVDHGVKVINISGFLVKKLIVSVDAWNSLEEAFGYAASKDVIIVVAAGNIAQEVEDYPGDEAHTIVAGASTLKDERWEQEMEIKGQKIKQGSCYGKRLTLMAPTEKILECVPHEKRFYECDDSPMGGTKNKFEGMHELFPNGATSSAAPIVTSLVALVRSLRPDLRAESVIEIIKQGCDDIGEKGYDISTGWGRVNFLKTLRLAKDFKQQGPEPSAPTPQPAQQQPREQNDEAR
jgi:subtilisin family serine protease